MVEAEEGALDPPLENGRVAFVLPLHHFLKAPPSQLLLRRVTFVVLPFLLLLLPVGHNSTGARRERMT